MKTQVVKFNVGGRKYEVARSLLESHPDTMLAKSISNRWQENHLEDEVYIEGNGDRFGYCLDYLRDGRCYLPWTVSKNAILSDLEYYGLDNVHEEMVIETAAQYFDFKLNDICKKLAIIAVNIESIEERQTQTLEINEIPRRFVFSFWERNSSRSLGILFFLLATVKLTLFYYAVQSNFVLISSLKAVLWLETILLLMISVKADVDPIVGNWQTSLLKVLGVATPTVINIIIVIEDHQKPLHMSVIRGFTTWFGLHVFSTVIYYHGVLKRKIFL